MCPAWARTGNDGRTAYKGPQGHLRGEATLPGYCLRLLVRFSIGHIALAIACTAATSDEDESNVSFIMIDVAEFKRPTAGWPLLCVARRAPKLHRTVIALTPSREA